LEKDFVVLDEKAGEIVQSLENHCRTNKLKQLFFSQSLSTDRPVC